MSTNYGIPVDRYVTALREEAAGAGSDPERLASIRAELEAVRRATAPAEQPVQPAQQDTGQDSGR